MMLLFADHMQKLAGSQLAAGLWKATQEYVRTISLS
jgi:hypothetical protein